MTRLGGVERRHSGHCGHASLRCTVKAMQIQTPDETRLHVEEFGAGTPLLMLSGGPGCVNYLRPVANLLHNRRCLLPDPRGVGQSGGEAQDIAGEIDDVEALRQQLGLERWALLGHSWGADLGLIYALERPVS